MLSCFAPGWVGLCEMWEGSYLRSRVYQAWKITNTSYTVYVYLWTNTGFAWPGLPLVIECRFCTVFNLPIVHVAVSRCAAVMKTHTDPFACFLRREANRIMIILKPFVLVLEVDAKLLLVWWICVYFLERLNNCFYPAFDVCTGLSFISFLFNLRTGLKLWPQRWAR